MGGVTPADREDTMKDHELDELLCLGAAPPPVAAVAAATELADRTRAGADELRVDARPDKRRRWWRRRLVLAAGLMAGVVVLSAGTSLTAHQLSIPPFQTVPDGVQRASVPIPLDYQRADGGSIRCQVFMEFQNLGRTQLRRIDDAVAGQDWSPERQRRLLGRPADAGVPRSEAELFTDKLSTHLHGFAAGVVPDLRDDDGSEQASFNGYGASCREVRK
jgi:hypothetical protein